MTPDGAELLNAAASGDLAALRKLLETHGPRLSAEIAAQIGPQWRSLVDAEDVMQVTYLEAFLQAQQLRGRDTAAFVAWLRRIAENNLRDAIKELSRKKRPDPGQRVHAPPGENSYVALVELLGQTTTTPSRHAARGELSGMMSAVLERLPTDYRAVIRMYDLEGRGVDEVATELGRSSGAVHMLRARAHDRLRELLGAETNFFTHTA